MKIAAYQAPLLPAASSRALDLIRTQINHCESESVSILCCPEAILGGLADYGNPTAIPASELNNVLAPLASDTVTTIAGFTELGENTQLYNSAAIFHRGSVIGVYRKLHPAFHRSVYTAGHDLPIFEVANLKLGIVICNDSNFPELATDLAARGAAVLFIPTNNALPSHRASAELIAESRAVDIATAIKNKMWVIRADVAGNNGELVSYGSSGIVDPAGTVVRAARASTEDLLIAELGRE